MKKHDYFGTSYQLHAGGQWFWVLLDGSETIALGEGYKTEQDADAAMFAEFFAITEEEP